jgi:hypothetical protein
MTRKKKPVVEEPPVRHLVMIGKDHRGKLGFLVAGAILTELQTVEIGRPFTHQDSGILIEGMDNKEAWSASKVLTGARLGWFGFKLEAP